MTVIATCGHVLADDEGPDGMGWPLALADLDRRYERQVSHVMYCTRCSTWARAEPGLVLQDDAQIQAWLSQAEPVQ